MFHILVADDDKNTRKFMRAVLEAEGYTVSAAENGEEALAIMESEYIDLAVVDITMPKMDGYEFTAALREVKSKLPILMVSAKQLSSDRKKGLYSRNRRLHVKAGRWRRTGSSHSCIAAQGTDSERKKNYFWQYMP